MFVHLRSHSYYSFLEGLASPGDLAAAAAGQDMPALALTDLRRLSGAIEFYTACQSAGIRPILGLEIAVSVQKNAPVNFAAPPGRLVLLAIDMTGWKSLCRLSSQCCNESSPNSSNNFIELDQLAQESSGVICMSGGLQGLLANLLAQDHEHSAIAWLNQLKDIFHDRLYVELQSHTPKDNVIVEGLATLASRQHLPMVATHNISYLTPDQASLQHLAAAMRLILPLEELPASAAAPPGAYFVSKTEMTERFSNYPEALASTLEIADRCRLELPLDKPLFPEIPLPPTQTVLDVLRDKAYLGAKRLYGKMTPQIHARLDHELSVIGVLGYASLFLVMQEILSFARQKGIPTASRGSASSSLVAHCLDITSPDPLSLNLYFERFLNPARSTPPDIDVDLCSRRRDEVIDFVYKRFGCDRVAMVCTVNRFRRRSALREVAKAYGLSGPKISALVENLPHRWYGPPRSNNREETPYSSLGERYTGPIYQQIFEHAAAMIGIPHHLSIHPGGVVIAPEPLTNLVPTQLAAKGILITQFDLDSIERLGLVKIDLLGIRGLSVLGDVARQESKSGEQAKNEKQIKIPQEKNSSQSTLEFLDAIPEIDPETSVIVRQGRTIGCFQIESPGMRATLREIQAASIEDILVALALYRPGPLTGGLKDAFVRRHLGKEAPTQLHPALTPLLSDTYGVILYQEQVLRIAHEFAGLSLADADLLRRAMSHFDPGKQMQSLKERFIAGASNRHRAPEETANKVWDLMAAFAGYGFPKAHAASYAQVAWRAAWCKTHYPAVFMAAVLANWGGYYSQRVYISEARRMGLEVRAPHVNFSSRQFSVQYPNHQPALFMGLDQVRDLTRRTQKRILLERPFQSLVDFLARADPRPQEAENLAKIGALQGFGSIPHVLETIRLGGWQGGQLPLFPITVGAEDWSLRQRVAAQEAILGASVDAHPLELVANQITSSGALTTLEASTQPGQRLRVAGMRQTWRRSANARGEYIYFMSLEDLEGMIDVVISADIYRHHRDALAAPGPYLIEGTVELRRDETVPYLRAERIELLHTSDVD
jgi:DNA-directed DNA polymerase III PolC